MPDTLAFGNSLVAAIPAVRRFAGSLTNDARDAQALVETIISRGWKDRDSFVEGDDLVRWLRLKALA